MNPANLMPLGMGQLPIRDVTGFVGDPRQYRYNASDGLFTREDGRPITNSKQPFLIIPLAFRLFHAETLFQRDNSRWLELMFINQLGNISHLMFHQHSVENFLRAQIVLTYDGYDACDVAWTITPTEKTRIVGKTTQKYYLLEFAHEALDEKTRIFHETIRGDHQFYRAYTLNLEGVTEIASKNWHGLKDTPIGRSVIGSRDMKALPAAVAPMPQAVPVETAIPKKN